MSASCARADGHAQRDQGAAAAGARRAVVDGLDRAAERAHGVEHALRRARELGDAADREPKRGGVVLCALPVGQRRSGGRGWRLDEALRRRAGANAGCCDGLAGAAARVHDGRQLLIGRLQVRARPRARPWARLRDEDARDDRGDREAAAEHRHEAARPAAGAGGAGGAARAGPRRASPRASARAARSSAGGAISPTVSSSSSAPMRRSRPSAPASPRSSASRRSGAIGSDVLMGFHLCCQARERAGEPRRAGRRRDLEQPRGLAGVELEQDAQRDDLAVGGAQPAEARLERCRVAVAQAGRVLGRRARARAAPRAARALRACARRADGRARRSGRSRAASCAGRRAAGRSDRAASRRARTRRR